MPRRRRKETQRATRPRCTTSKRIERSNDADRRMTTTTTFVADGRTRWWNEQQNPQRGTTKSENKANDAKTWLRVAVERAQTASRRQRPGLSLLVLLLTEQTPSVQSSERKKKKKKCNIFQRSICEISKSGAPQTQRVIGRRRHQRALARRKLHLCV
jgi:hypothetical protein